MEAARDTMGKRHNHIAKWLVWALVSDPFDECRTAALRACCAGRPCPRLNNGDVNGDSYQGVSNDFTLDICLTHPNQDSKRDAPICQIQPKTPDATITGMMPTL